MSRIAERRNRLADWLHQNSGRGPYTLGEIVAMTNIYDGRQREACRRDLGRLAANGVVRMIDATPARWEKA